MKNLYFLQIDTYMDDTGVPYDTKREAIDAYGKYVADTTRWGNTPSAGLIYIAANEGERVDDPDFMLSVGPRSGIRCERC